MIFKTSPGCSLVVPRSKIAVQLLNTPYLDDEKHVFGGLDDRKRRITKLKKLCRIAIIHENKDRNKLAGHQSGSESLKFELVHEIYDFKFQRATVFDIWDHHNESSHSAHQFQHTQDRGQRPGRHLPDHVTSAKTSCRAHSKEESCPLSPLVG